MRKKKTHIHTIAAFIFAQSPETRNKIHADVRILLRFSAASAEEEDADWSSLPTPGCDPKLQLRTKPDPETRLRTTRLGWQGRSAGVRFSGSRLFVRTAALPSPASNHPHQTQHPATTFKIKLLLVNAFLALMNKTAVHLIAIYISASVCDALLFTIMVTNIPKNRC